jgi:hypothetical protein
MRVISTSRGEAPAYRRKALGYQTIKKGQSNIENKILDHENKDWFRI